MKEPKDIANTRILEIIKGSPQGGISIQGIEQQLSMPIPRRTLQRRLSDLVAKQLIISIGKYKRIKYHLFSSKLAAFSHSTEALEKEKLKTFRHATRESSKIKQYLQQPLHSRRLIGFNRAFLNAYSPNQTPYLSKQICDYLHKIAGFSQKRPPNNFAQEILNTLSTELCYHSSRLSGNSYSKTELQQLIELAIPAKEKSIREAQMIFNHKSAIEYLVTATDGYNAHVLLNLQAILADNLSKNLNSYGRLRQHALKLSKTAYRPLEQATLIEEGFQKIIDKINKIEDPFEQAFFALVQFSYLLPFEDANLSFAHLAANIAVFKHNCCPLIFKGVSETDFEAAILGIYELNQVDLMRELFVFSIETSVAHFSEVIKHLSEPNIYKMRYHREIKTVIKLIFQTSNPRTHIKQLIQHYTLQHIPAADQTHFRDLVEQELRGLHEGNLERYQISLSEFKGLCFEAVDFEPDFEAHLA